MIVQSYPLPIEEKTAEELLTYEELDAMTESQAKRAARRLQELAARLRKELALYDDMLIADAEEKAREVMAASVEESIVREAIDAENWPY